MKLYAIERKKVPPTVKMRTHKWLDTKTLKARHGVQVYDKSKTVWAHVYDETSEEKVMLFDTEDDARALIRRLKETPNET
jgi:hypothetical protein